jgi:hypothetical protein
VNWLFMGQYIYCPIDSGVTLLFMKRVSTRHRDPLPASYRRLLGRLQRTGWVALGSLLERKLPGGGGPRYQWSRRVKGKTVTVALGREQFAWLKKAIANQRKIESLLDEMHRQTLNFMWNNLPNPSRRKRLSNRTLGLN